MVNQLNQDPQAASIADSSCGTTAMEGSEADAVGDEVEGQDEGATAGAVPEMGVANITWDPEDPFLKFTDENPSTTQILIAALTPMSMPTEESIPGLKEPDIEEPQAEGP